MREILFRGKRADNGEWVEGYYSCRPFISEYEHVITNYRELKRHKGISSIEYQMNYNEVIPETVGQYTGIWDNNGENIFEGDIVFCFHYDDVGQVVYLVDEAKFAVEIKGLHRDFSEIYSGSLAVIGNIHDNPELLGVTDINIGGKGGAE